MNQLDTFTRLSNWMGWRDGSNPSLSVTRWEDERPLRAELLSIDQLEQHAKSVAASHKLSSSPGTDMLLRRLRDNERILIDTYDLVTSATEQSRHIEPVAEWLLDNFYLMEDQIRAIRRLLPPSYSRELPRLETGTGGITPRVYGIAIELISHADGRIDATGLNRFVSAYQSVTPLKLGELWALPLMLRLALIENLRRVAVRIAAARRDRDQADAWATRMVSVVEQRSTDLILVLADMARTKVPLTGAFLSELTRRLQGQNPNFALVMGWIENRLADDGLTTQQLVNEESQSQAADQVSIGNSITSLRYVSLNDWRQFVTEHSFVERILSEDPAAIYKKSDFATCDRYRHAIEGIARRSPFSEIEVARKAVQLATQKANEDPGSRAAHVGYYLVDRGRPALERLSEMGFVPSVVIEKLRRKIPLVFYLIVTGLVSFMAVLLLQRYLYLSEVNWPAIALLSIPAFVCASSLGIGIANWLATQSLSPQPLPRLDFSKGIPPECRTVIAVPTLLTSSEGVLQLLEALELRYLGNRDSSLHFALLTDFADATTETRAEDSGLLQQACEGIDRLNEKYSNVRAGIFFLFHRNRTWNEQQKIWMGYERKRGKLADLNAALRGAGNGFSVVVGETGCLTEVRYVITLDTDTQLPSGSACQMIGTLAHPLNEPVWDPNKRIVVDGYTILQPRVGVGLTSARRSRFALLHSEEPGVDPYTRVVSDVYQDLFSEGSFIGKGIYHVDAFDRFCNDFPENMILSHDLIEGAYSRSALLSDVTLYEEYPSRYLDELERRHRWIRGDWQIAAWLLPHVRNRSGQRVRNPISWLSRWKILDNLRRSLSLPAMLLLLLGSWCFSTSASLAVTLFLACVIFLPSVLSVISHLFRKPIDIPWHLHATETMQSLRQAFFQNALSLIFLPFEAAVCADAIVRTLIRMLWTKRKLLEWKTSSEAQRGSRFDLLHMIRRMAIAPVVALASLILIASLNRPVLGITIPWILVWTISPWIGWWLSQPVSRHVPRLSADQQQFLEKVARKTWRYFEMFVTETDHWLAPDNIQQNPNTVVAHRTSPTNIGMGILSELAAYDFGYSAASQLLDRVEKTVETMEGMERYRGHFFNWYDTQSLMPLYPNYISSVDSGNLAAMLIVFANGCHELTDAPILPRRTFGGLKATALVLLDAAGNTEHPKIRLDMISKIRASIEELDRRPSSLRTAFRLLTRSHELASDLMSQLEVNASSAFASAVNSNEADEELRWWVHAWKQECQTHRNDLLTLAPWLDIPTPPEELLRTGSEESQARLESVRAAIDSLESSGSVRILAESKARMERQFDVAVETASEATKPWLLKMKLAFGTASDNAVMRVQRLEGLASRCRELSEMDFKFLYDEKRDLFAIGYNFSDRRLDGNFYDLLASEARLFSFMLVAQGHVGQDHWFALGRMLTSAGRVPALLSWSGSMFEYLMPILVMPDYENTLLNRTYQAVVLRQVAYGRQRGVPWGISESGYNTIDQHRTYQYRAFGVPGLGLKRGLADDLVIAPYASALALMVMPDQACRNLQKLAAQGHQGAYGMVEAVDYTPSRLPPGTTSVAVKQYMAHHQGMSLLSFEHFLLNKPMQQRFLSEPTFRSADLLLQERVPKATARVYPHASEANATRLASAEETGTMRVLTDPNSPTVDVHLLSNGRYHVMVTSAGGGYSRWQETAITRWRQDATRDCYGSFCYVRDTMSGAVWSNSWQPTARGSKNYESIFTQDRAEFRRVDDQIETYTQISVSPEDDVELRRVTLTNRSDQTRTLEVTSYAEVVLAPQSHDESHPAFSNLFVQTEVIRSRQAIYCTRRPRSAEEHPPWMTHMLRVRGATAGEPSYETDRMKFIGRLRSLANPYALESTGPLSGTDGSVLDPIVSIRQAIVLQPSESIRIDLITGVSESRAGIDSLTHKYSDVNFTDRVFDLAWTYGHVMLQQAGISETDAQCYGKLAGSIVYTSSLRRARPSLLLRNRRGQSGLWGYGISGDLPIVLLKVRDLEQMQLVQQVVQAHTYWRLKGLAVDLVIWNEDESVYRQSLQEAIINLVGGGPEANLIDRPGGIFVRRGEQMTEEDRVLLQAVARIVVSGDGESLAEFADRRSRTEIWIPNLKTTPSAIAVTKPELGPPDLAYFNGLGGFSHDGREYVTKLLPKQTTPSPWCNVIANSQFGTVISEAGCAYTWFENCHEYRITPWYNDPVTDVCGEAIYIRDEESGRYWSPTPLPARGRNTYVSRHGFGYSIFDYTEDGITTELSVYVATDAAVKFCKLKISNRSGRPRQLSATGYWELVLGDTRNKSLPYIVTELDPDSGAIIASNRYSPEFSDSAAFFQCSEAIRSHTGDRTEFLGRNGKLASPAAMQRVRLSGRLGAGFDPCVAIQAPFSLSDGQEKIITFTVGAAPQMDATKFLAQRFQSVDSAHQAIEKVWDYWSRTLGAVYLETPDQSLNFLANGWLIYQTISCRMWARSGFYQSGGAFGFRDQLQDAMALIHAQPQLLREQLIRAAGRQFHEGDAQHWWHPPGGRGVRTHFSDDYLWLPLAMCRYVAATGDTGVLDERIPFLTSRALRDDEESYYDLPHVSDDVGSLYEHGVRAIEHGLKFGVHGLPLMGCGDWNDGMNLVGKLGKGESVWLAFFLYHILEQFNELARQRGDASRADRYAVEAGRLRGSIEGAGWDGQWYRRAYFDDGTPLGSATNEECQIDSISQSWSVLSKAGTRDRTRVAMENVYRRLVRPKDQLILLLDPPFDRSSLEPGYIKGYVPGVRENGGQYTHAAIWTVMAAAATGDNEKAWELFSMINPITHGMTPESIATYRVEPYVVAADVYSVPPHAGRGGWTWYTGSAGWMYRLIVESLVGLRLDTDKLSFAPCLPSQWKEFQVHYRYRETFYHIQIHNHGIDSAERRIVVDGIELSDAFITMVDDRQDHNVIVKL